MKVQSTISIIVAVICFSTFTLLLLYEKIETTGYFSLLLLLSFVCLAIPVISRFKKIDIKNLKLTLEKIEYAKSDIYAKEKSLKEISYTLSELIATTSTLTGIWGDKDSTKYSQALVRNKINKLCSTLEIPADKVEGLFKYQIALDELHQFDDNDEKRKQKWQEFIELLKVDSEKNI